MKRWLKAFPGELVWALCCEGALAINLPAPPTTSGKQGSERTLKVGPN
jgi:hypothetical protein